MISERDSIILISTMANAYSQYTTTYEEYKAQRYEGGSTLFGPHQLSAYLQTLDNLTIAMARNQPIPPGPKPEDLSRDQLSFITPVLLDTFPPGKPFGTVEVQPRNSYRKGENVTCEFWSAHLDNNFINVETYFTIEFLNGTNWIIVKNDSDEDTYIKWIRFTRNLIYPDSKVNIKWEVNDDVASGTYRIRHFGWAKENAFSPNLTPYSGQTNSFTIL